MLIQDDSTRPNMSAAASLQGNLQRSSWKAEAIRRGDLKISGPIPLTEDMPLNEEEEEEFEKHGKLSPSPQQDTSVYQPTQHNPDPPQVPSPAPGVARTETHPQASAQPEETLQQEARSRISPPMQLSVPMQTTPERHRRSATEPISISSPIPPTPETPTQTSTRRKRKSGLRNVFRKMFGRKGKDEQDEYEVSPVQRMEQPRKPQRDSVR